MRKTDFRSRGRKFLCNQLGSAEGLSDILPLFGRIANMEKEKCVESIKLPDGIVRPDGLPLLQVKVKLGWALHEGQLLSLLKKCGLPEPYQTTHGWSGVSDRRRFDTYIYGYGNTPVVEIDYSPLIDEKADLRLPTIRLGV